MNLEEILHLVNEVFKDVFENEDLIISNATTSNDIPDWDSLMHIQLVYGMEKKFNIRFTAKEIGNYKNVGEMCEGIFTKLS
jgi:acyl carrier protein